MNNIFHLIPKDKFDNSSIETLRTIDVDKATPILGSLLEWLQDLNWPVAKELIDVLPRFHVGLIPHIESVFSSNDDIWKYWTLRLIKKFPIETVNFLAPAIKRMAENPTAGEVIEETNIYALEIIEIFNL